MHIFGFNGNLLSHGNLVAAIRVNEDFWLQWKYLFSVEIAFLPQFVSMEILALNGNLLVIAIRVNGNFWFQWKCLTSMEIAFFLDENLPLGACRSLM